jgi:signal transduction histidine kinase
MRLLLVEDSRTAVKMVEGLLAEEEERQASRFDLTVAGTLAAAEAALRRDSFDLILLDLTLPDSYGLDTVDTIVATAPRTPVVVLTSTADEKLGLQALKKGAQDFLVKDETYRKVLVRSVRYAYLRNLAEQEIREARDMAEFATSSKSSFIANLSHELRTPLNAIIGFSELMLAEIHAPLAGKHREYTTDIHNSGRYLLGLIGTVLDMSKIEAQKIELRDQALDLGQLIGDTVSGLRDVEGALDRLTTEVAPGLPAFRGDWTKMRQILNNLVSNALKYSPEGGPVTVRLIQDPESGDLILTVADAGIGIPSEQIEGVLRPFNRTTVSRARQIEGTGLGLPLTKGLVEAHDGTLTLDSELHVGTTVTVRLPASRVAPPVPDQVTGP